MSAHSPSEAIPNTGSGPSRLSATEWSNAYNRQMEADWQHPIDFYGKVVDEKTNPVEGASIRFQWSDLTDNVTSNTATSQSDAAGLFSLHNKHGRSLDVWVAKEGYYASHGGYKGFLYAIGNDLYSPDIANPVVFKMRKKGTTVPLVSLKQNYRIPRDGTPISIDLTTGATTKGKNGNLVVQCWTDDQGKRSGEKYNWRCIVTIPGGGIVPTDEEFAFQAPDRGYISSTEIVMPVDHPDWKSDVDLKFYYRLADARYGKMTFSMIAGGQHFCMINSALNPSGSRNLEPAQ